MRNPFVSLLRLSAPVLLLACVTAPSSAPREASRDDATSQYPATRLGDTVDDYHGNHIADPYRWLEALDSDETMRWIQAQNHLSVPHLESLPARDALMTRFRELSRAVPPGTLRKQGRFWVTKARRKDGSYRFLVQDDLEAPARVLLDPETMGLEDEAVLREARVSPDGRYVAYTIALGGMDLMELRIRDLASGRDLPDRIADLKFDMPHWTGDSRGLVYWRYLVVGNSRPDGIDRESAVAHHLLGTPAAEDRVLARADPAEVGATTYSAVSDDGRFVIVFDSLGFESAISVLDLVSPLEPRFDGPLVPLSDERAGDTGLAGTIGAKIYLRTTMDAPNGRVVAVTADDPTHWATVIPETEHLLQHALVVGGHLVAAYRRDVKSALEIYDPDGTRLREVPLPGPGSTFWYGGTSDSPTLTYAFDSFTHPRATYRHDIANGDTSLLAFRDIEVELSEYTTRQTFFLSQDGTQVPMFVAHRTDLEPTGDTPTLLQGYGAAGAVNDPMFVDAWFAWIEAGGILAVANVRGGGEYGEEWHKAGMLGEKQNSYDDFIAAAEHLIAQGYTNPERLAITGESNGGLLVGAVMVQRPDLFAVALPVVGVLDALRFPSFTAGPRWARDMGDPAIEEQFEWLRSWSPLHGLKDGTCYPATLISTAANDDLVHPSQSYKFAARLQAAQSCDRPALLRVYPEGGHRFTSDPARRSTVADLLSFAAHHTGLGTTETAR